MNNKQIIELHKIIIELEKTIPKDDLILSYNDFLAARDYLGVYQFNPIVFHNLVKITNDNWRTSSRINRLSLLLHIKKYLHVTLEDTVKGYYKRVVKSELQLSTETKELLFNLFKNTFEEEKYISEKQLDQARKICNNILISLVLTAKEEEWLCSNFYVSDLILNRILRYPVKSKIISQWAKNSFLSDKLKSRRAEHISWIIDQEPNFEIDQQTLIEDFEYLNKLDAQALENYCEEVVAYKMKEKELELVDNISKHEEYDYYDGSGLKKNENIPVPQLKLPQRPYSIRLDTSNEFANVFSMGYYQLIPNFEETRRSFYTELPTFQKLTMIWAITYSRLSNEHKFNLLKKYYCDETYYSMVRVGKRMKNVDLLKWIMEQQ